jgi:hypothetical protein
VEQLRELMKLTGAVSEARAASFPALRQLKIVKDFRARDPDNREPIRQVLYSAASSLEGVQGQLSIPNSDIGVAALGLGRWDGRGLKLLDRLTELGQEYGFTGLSTMRGYIGPVAELLARKLRKMTVEDVVPMDGWSDPKQVNEHEAHLHWVYDGKVLQRHHARRTLRAGAEPLTSYTAYFTYPNDPGPDIAAIRPYRNCSEGQQKRQRTGQFELTVRVPETSPVQMVTFEYEIFVTSKIPDRSYLRHLTRMPAAHATVSVQFNPQCMPTHVNPFERAGQDFEPQGGVTSTAIAVSSSGYVEHTFNQQLNTWFGFGWSWPGED